MTTKFRLIVASLFVAGVLAFAPTSLAAKKKAAAAPACVQQKCGAGGAVACYCSTLPSGENKCWLTAQDCQAHGPISQISPMQREALSMDIDNNDCLPGWTGELCLTLAMQ